MPQTNERAFETYVEEILLTRGGWKSAARTRCKIIARSRVATSRPEPVTSTSP